MRRCAQVVLLLLSVSAAVVLAPLFASAGQLAMKANFFNWVVDEQSHVGCPNPPLVAPPYFSGDITADPSAVGPTTAYTTAPWTVPQQNLTSVAYVNGTDCDPAKGTCLAVDLNKNQTVLSIDSRNSQDATTGKPRDLVLNFAQPCAGCPYGPGPANPFGASPLATPGLLSVFLTVPYTGMAICSTTDCPESEPGTARFWFNDPNGNTNLQWRVDWGYVRVLRVATNTWYVLADGCDGSQVATLYQLANNRKKITTSRQGQYLIPFFASGVQ
ncbi:MAG: hypothetical protein ACR2IF_04165 [Terriglobales bacterium]